MLVPVPWHRGSVALLGDAAHATTLHLTTGASLAVEDALVLTEELEGPRNVARQQRCHERALVGTSRFRGPLDYMKPFCFTVQFGSLQTVHCWPTNIDASESSLISCQRNHPVTTI